MQVPAAVGAVVTPVILPSRVLAAMAGGQPTQVGRCVLVATDIVGQVVVGAVCTRCAGAGNATVPPDPPRCVLGRRGPLARALAARCRQVLADATVDQERQERVLELLSTSPEPAARLDAARSAHCPEPVLATLVGDWWWEVRAGVASNPSRSPAAARALAEDPSVWVRRALAEALDVDPGTLGVLARDPDFGVRDAVAERHDCPAHLLERFARDEVWEIRRSVAKRRDAPDAVLRALAHDPEHWVRFFVACNPATPEAVRAGMEDDARPTVRAVARLERDRARSVAMHLASDGREASRHVQ